MCVCVCVCVCVCGTVAMWYTTSINNQNPVLWGFWTMSSPVNRILATTSTINQDPAMWGFWIMSNPGSRFLDLFNTVYIQAIPTLWGFCIMSRPDSRVLLILYTTPPQPNTPTSYLLTCLPLPEMGRATGEDTPGLSKSKPNQKSGHSAPASRERRQGGASRVRRKDRH